MNRRITLAVAALCLLGSACGPGGLLSNTATPSATSTAIPTLTSVPTEAPAATATVIATATATATATPSPALTAAALACPKGTVLRPSVNRCFYATRTPKPEHSICEDYGKASECRANGCTWIRKTRSCSP